MNVFMTVFLNEWRSLTLTHIHVFPTTFVKPQTIVEPTPHPRTAVEAPMI
jgi:hypothetical protein